MRTVLRVAAGVLAVVLALVIVRSAWVNVRTEQWDFRTYYSAAQADAAGLDPYKLDSLSQVAGGAVRLPFVYPPAVLGIMKPFLWTDIHTAKRVFLVLKCLAAAGLIALWARGFLRDGRDGLFWLFCLIAFQGALWLDVLAGNVTVFEQLLLWLGFLFFLRGRLPAFCLCVLLASVFKLAPVAFLGLLPFTNDRRKYVCLGAGLAAFALLLFFQYAWRPDLFAGFLHAAAGIDERGMRNNPSLLALVQDTLQVFASRFGMTVRPGVGWAAYAAAAAGILGVTYRFWRRANLDDGERRLVLLSLACVVAALVLPRFKSYAFIQLLLPAYLLMRRLGDKRPVVFGGLFAVAVLTDRFPGGFLFPQREGLCSLLFFGFCRYYSLVLAAGVWALYLGRVLRPPASSPAGAERSPAA
jgi:hypothetical protein